MLNKKIKNKIFSIVTTLLVFSFFSINPLPNNEASELPSSLRLFNLWEVVNVTLRILKETNPPEGPGKLAETLQQELDAAEKEGGATAEALKYFRDIVQTKPFVGAKLINHLYYSCIKSHPKEQDGCKKLAYIIARLAFKQREKELAKAPSN